jgi:YNFM family putative membrane transporter
VEQDTYIRRGTGLYVRANLALFIAGLVTFSTLYTFQPLFPVLVEYFRISPASASLTLSVSTFALAWMLPISGSISDSFGRRKLMGLALILTSALSIVCAMSSTLNGLLALRLLQGAVLAGVPAVAMAYLNDEMSERAIGPAMGLYIAGNACGGMSGRILTSWFVDMFTWQMSVAIIGGLALVMSVLFWVLLPPSRHFRQQDFHLKQLSVSLIGHLRDPGLICLYLLAFLLMGSFVTVYNYVTFYLLDAPYNLSQSQVALIFFAYAFGAGGSSMVGGLSERWGRQRLFMCSLLTMGGGLFLTLAQPLLLIIVGIVILTIGFFAAHSLASAWVGTRAPVARAQASSLYLLAYYLGSSISGTGGGFVWSIWGWNGVVILVTSLLVAAAGVLHVLRRIGSSACTP